MDHAIKFYQDQLNSLSKTTRLFGIVHYNTLNLGIWSLMLSIAIIGLLLTPILGLSLLIIWTAILIEWIRLNRLRSAILEFCLVDEAALQLQINEAAKLNLESIGAQVQNQDRVEIFLDNLDCSPTTTLTKFIRLHLLGR